MSIDSYKRNVSKRVTGRSFPTCFPAALEQISPNHGYRPNIYRDYSDFINWYCSLTLKERDKRLNEYEGMISHMVKPLGGLACEDLVLSRATTPAGFLRVVRPLLSEGFRVTVDISRSGGKTATVHTVGLLPVETETDHVTLVSTSVPNCLSGIVTLRQVADHLAISNLTYSAGYHPVNNANILALPPI